MNRLVIFESFDITPQNPLHKLESTEKKKEIRLQEDEIPSDSGFDRRVREVHSLRLRLTS